VFPSDEITRAHHQPLLLASRTREVGFVLDAGGRLERFEAKWTQFAFTDDRMNLAFVRNAVGRSRVAGGGVLCRAPSSYPLPNGFRAPSVTDMG
jgi:hypothetical protein